MENLYLQPNEVGNTLSVITKKKKKKKVSRNVLSLPRDLKAREPVAIPESALSTLTEELRSLLPGAKILKTEKEKQNEEKMESGNNSCKKKRNELFIGINSLSKGMKNELVSAALVDDKISPPQLIHHLCFISEQLKIPLVKLPLRSLVSESLGFPTIALGFKKECSSFTAVVNMIKSILESTESVSEVKTESECREKIINDHEVKNSLPEIKFTYKYRTSCNSRAFVPETSGEKDKHSNEIVEQDFISVSSDEKIGNVKGVLGISKNFVNKRKMEIKDEEIKEKRKKDLIQKSLVKYSPTVVMKFQSNPDRKKMKSKKIDSKKK